MSIVRSMLVAEPAFTLPQSMKEGAEANPVPPPPNVEDLEDSPQFLAAQPQLQLEATS